MACRLILREVLVFDPQRLHEGYVSLSAVALGSGRSQAGDLTSYLFTCCCHQTVDFSWGVFRFSHLWHFMPGQRQKLTVLHSSLRSCWLPASHHSSSLIKFSSWVQISWSSHTRTAHTCCIKFFPQLPHIEFLVVRDFPSLFIDNSTHSLYCHFPQNVLELQGSTCLVYSTGLVRSKPHAVLELCDRN
jgi:hypothetical protein